jgi:calcineurin-like phosphoesterase family protein
LGDFAFADAGKIKHILHRLNGQKNLILGNHDNQIIRTPAAFVGKGLFNSVHSYKEIKIGNTPIVLMHYGMRVWNKSHHGAWHLYGHSHGTLPPYGKSLDVGVDDKTLTYEYRPYSFDEIKQFMDNQNIAEKTNNEKNNTQR